MAGKKVPGVGSAFKKLGGIMAGVFAVRKVAAFVSEAVTVHNQYAVAVSKLGQVMSNTMEATDTHVKKIQELTTYLTKTESLEKLTPVMNDMLAQQYGLNASQEQAIKLK